MFLFGKKNIQKVPILRNDLHSHLIPGIDDGSQSIEDTLEILHMMSNLGYKKIITTPHIMADTYRNSTKCILDGLATLREAIFYANIDIKIDVAAEYYLDELFLERLNNGDILTLGGGYLLFETSYISKPINFEEIIFKMTMKGYKPLLAHPERYRYISHPKKIYSRMKELNIYFQLDINSLGGYYGKDALRLAKLLSRWGMIDFLGSDIHYKKQVLYLESVFKSREYQNIWINNNIKNVFL